jgi:phosphatidylinositol alpha-1,6-mannosyltransferase
VLLPSPSLKTRIDALAEEVGARFVVLDPALPVGALGRSLNLPYVVVLHGSELIGRMPGGSQLMGRVVSGAAAVIAAGNYPASEAARVAGRATPPVTIVAPGVDARRFRPLDPAARASARKRFQVDADASLVVGLSRLVPRKGFDVLIDAASDLAPRYPELAVVIGGTGRDAERLQRRIERTGAPARMTGRVDDVDMPLLYGSADVFAMCCRTRWGGLEPEGFGIVFLEAAACGVPQVAGRSGGAADAVADGKTGLVVQHPGDRHEVADALDALLRDPERRRVMGDVARARVEAEFTYDHLAKRLADALESVSGG